jgi:hypothetical protein
VGHKKVRQGEYAKAVLVVVGLITVPKVVAVPLPMLWVNLSYKAAV